MEGPVSAWLEMTSIPDMHQQLSGYHSQEYKQTWSGHCATIRGIYLIEQLSILAPLFAQPAHTKANQAS